jgi:asparagine synthase (glutamine-hydrolysing)
MEFVASLPAQMKIRGKDKKRVLKLAVRDWLPKEVLNRKKMGFGVPIDSWLRGELNQMAHDLLLDQTARTREILAPRRVEQLLQSHESGIDRGRQLWPLLCLELWFREIHDSTAWSPLRSGSR